MQQCNGLRRLRKYIQGRMAIYSSCELLHNNSAKKQLELAPGRWHNMEELFGVWGHFDVMKLHSATSPCRHHRIWIFDYTNQEKSLQTPHTPDTTYSNSSPLVDATDHCSPKPPDKKTLSSPSPSHYWITHCSIYIYIFIPRTLHFFFALLLCNISQLL